jgi:hypothetical protein
MAPDFIYYNDSLIINGLTRKQQVSYLLKIGMPFLILFSVYFWGYLFFEFALVIGIILFTTLRHFLPFPANFFGIIIKKQDGNLWINKKVIPYEDLLFLSLREKDFYKIIRLEAKRKNILIANEKILASDCEGFEDALSLCREIKSFIDPNLKINNIKIGTGRANNYGDYTSSGGRNENIEIWEYVD